MNTQTSLGAEQVRLQQGGGINQSLPEPSCQYES